MKNVVEYYNSHVNFYKIAGLLSCFHAELTKFSSYDLQYDLNSRDFDSLVDILLMCLKNSSSQDPKSWEFLTNSKYSLYFDCLYIFDFKY